MELGEEQEIGQCRRGVSPLSHSELDSGGQQGQALQEPHFAIAVLLGPRPVEVTVEFSSAPGCVS